MPEETPNLNIDPNQPQINSPVSPMENPVPSVPPANSPMPAVSQPTPISVDPLAAPPGVVSPDPGQNTSGMGSGYPAPVGVAGWGWGPFLLSWIWAIGNGVWIGLIALIFNPWAFVLGFKGREWAWQAKKWESVEAFNKTQRKWSLWGIILLVIPILIIFVIAAINPVGKMKKLQQNQTIQISP